MYLHENEELFKKIIENTKEQVGLSSPVIEKDYYVTMILRLISKKTVGLGDVVFKGGTSLSKCHKVINRFSEDIDITFTEHLGEKRRKKLKYDVMKALSEELRLPIKNWEYVQSDRDLNSYLFDYTTIFETSDENLREGVKVETALASYSFPTETMLISSYVGDFLLKTQSELAKRHCLEPFEMKTQSLSRTFIDKVYATCDYYLQGKTRRLSRHIYDLHKIFPRMKFDDEFKRLVKEVRALRTQMDICPSAKPGVNVSQLIQKYCAEDFYKADFEIITDTLINEDISYSKVIETMLKITSFDFW
ncbi:MAG: nucleotidyl transferase AbiEii/AbiGii toxin family protein [Treponema sp.]|nr:nucleotidyl transferase AbiEii/AbiGii toxin family protein [Treponema sp.]